MWLHLHCLINKVLLIEHLSTIPQFFELCNVALDFFRSRWPSLLWLNSCYWVESITILKLQTQQVSQPVWKKEFSPFDQAMAGPRTCRSLGHNPPLGGEDELARGPSRAPIEGSNTPTPTPPISRAQILSSAQAPTLPSNKGLFHLFIKAYLENQNQNQALLLALIQAELWEQPWRPGSPTFIMKILI